MKILNGITLTGNAIINANSLTVGTTQLTTANGNVGIGITNPSQSLHTSGNIRLDSTILFNGTNAYPRIRRATNDLAFDTNTATDVLTIKDGGKIGIGTTTPSAELHITDSNAEILRLERTGGFGNAAIGASSLGSMVFFGKPQIGSFAVGASFDLTSSPYLTIASNGNIGIGAGSTPADKLHLEGNLYLGTTSRTIYTAGSANLVLQTNTGAMTFLRNAGSNESMRISSGGSLGVGTQSPIAKVDVVGEIRTSDKFGYGASAYTQYNSTTKSIDFIFA